MAGWEVSDPCFKFWGQASKGGFMLVRRRTLVNSASMQCAVATVILFLPASMAHAADVSCACPAGSLNAVLATLDKSVPNTVSVTGMCQESVLVAEFSDLTLSGAGPMAGIERPAALGPDLPALDIRNSGAVAINGFSIQGPNGETASEPLVRFSRSTGYLSSVRIQGSNGDGIEVRDFSTIYMAGSLIKDNKGSGVLVDSNGSAFLSAYWIASATAVEGNGIGITVTDNGAATRCVRGGRVG